MPNIGRNQPNELEAIRRVLDGETRRYVPVEDQESDPASPAEGIVAAADVLPPPTRRTLVQGDFVFPPWEPTGDETPKKTVEGIDLQFSPDPPQSAGGSIPSSKTHMNRFGPDEG